MPASKKLLMAVHLLNSTLLANLLLLCNDVSPNPGLVDANADLGFSSFASDESFTLSFGTASSISNIDEENYSSSYVDLCLGEKGLRIGHWNVNYLTADKFVQIKLYLLGNSCLGKPQLDALFLSETFLKPDVPNTLYAVPGFSIYRRDRKFKSGGGIMAFINQHLTVKRRIDLKSQNIEAIWLEIFPFKSNRSLILGSVYCPPSSSKEDDIKIEANMEGIHLLNMETIIVSDINIDYSDKQGYAKQRLSKGLCNVHLKQLVDFTTRPVGKSCLDHVYCNQPQRIRLVTSHNIGLSDHLPVFVVRKYTRDLSARVKTGSRIKYQDMKHFHEKQFLQSLLQAPWDTAFLFDDIDNVI